MELPTVLSELFANAGNRDVAQSSGVRSTIAHDGSGKLYVAGRDIDGSVELRCADCRQHLVAGPWSKGGATKGTDVSWPVRIIRPEPALKLRVEHCEVNCSGTYVLLAEAQGDSEREGRGARAVLLDLASSRPKRGCSGVETCEWQWVGQDSLMQRVGLRILQVAWHPHSDAHFCVLTSNNAWSMYNVDDVSKPEQDFDLELRPRRRFGLATQEDSRQAVAFAFGTNWGWNWASVYFLSRDESLFSLCPVAPFGGTCSAAVLDGLFAELAGDATEPTTLAWLQRAFPSYSADDLGSNQRDRACATMKVSAHALEDHVPALVGPLPVASSSRDAVEYGVEGASAVAATSLQYGDGSLHVLCTASCEGVVRLYLNTTAIQPRWAEAAPQVLEQGGQVHLRSCCPVVRGVGTGVTLLDVLDCEWEHNVTDGGYLGEGSGDEDEEEGDAMGEGSGVVRLLPDMAVGDTLYCCCSTDAAVIRVRWLPLLSYVMEEGNVEDLMMEGVPPLQSPALEELYSTQGGDSIIGSAAVGDPLTGSPLLLLTDDGTPHCLWPPPPSGNAEPNGSAEPTSAKAASDPQAEVDAQVSSIYRDIRAGPSSSPSLPPGAPSLTTTTPEGERQLNNAIAVLRERFVEFIHKANHDLTARMDVLQQLHQSQTRHADRIEAQYKEAAQRAQRIDTRVQKAVELNTNLLQRLQLLAERHLSVPKSLSTSELQFRDAELPLFETHQRQLLEDVQELQRRASLLHSHAYGTPQRSRFTPINPVPPAQMRRMKEVLFQCEAVASRCRHKLDVLDQTLCQETQQDA